MEPSIPSSTTAASGTGQSGAWRRAAARDVAIDPVAIAAGLGVIAALAAALMAAGVPLGTAERLTAAAVLLLSAGLVARGASNGVVLVFLLPPVFNGEDFRPYFVLLQGLVLLTLARAAVGRLAARRPLRAAGWTFLALFCASALLALPLDGRELWLEFQVSPLRDVLRPIVRGELGSRFYYVHVVLNILAGAALYVVVASQEWSRERLLRLAVAVAGVQVAVTGLGLWLYYRNPWPEARFFTVWVGGEATGGFTGFGFNVSYFAQYATAYLPLAGLALVERAPLWARALAVGALALASFAILLTGQRGAYLVLALIVVLLLVVVRRLHPTIPRIRRTTLTTTLAALLIAGATALAFSSVGSLVAARIVAKWEQGDIVRTHLLAVTGRIFREEPLLGVGSGRFFSLFHFYSDQPQLQFATWSTHFLYTQFLAEQGVLGLLGFCGLLAVTLPPAVRQVWRGSAPPPAAFLLVSLAGWLVYGLLQYTFLMRAMQCYFWIALGLLVALTGLARPPRRVSGRWLLAGGLVLVVLLGLRLDALRQWPVAPSWGLYPSEGTFRWTVGGAWLTLPVEGRILRLTLSGPDPRLTGRPQEVRVMLDGVPVARLHLDAAGWRTVDVPVDRPVGTPVRLEIGVAYSFVPAALGLNNDVRRLGVALQPVRWVNP